MGNENMTTGLAWDLKWGHKIDKEDETSHKLVIHVENFTSMRPSRMYVACRSSFCLRTKGGRPCFCCFWVTGGDCFQQCTRISSLLVF